MTLPLAYPDAEQVAMDLLSPIGLATTWIPPDPTPPLVVVQRIGGGTDEWDMTDYPLLRILFYGGSRDEAWNLSREGEKMLLGSKKKTVDRPGTASDGVLIDDVSLLVGGLLDPDLDPDDRRVTTNYVLAMRRQYHLQEV